MPRIWAKFAEGHYSVTVSGRLHGRDLRRLEHACGPALEHRMPPLTIRILPDSDMDEPARAYLRRLTIRGAVLVFE